AYLRTLARLGPKHVVITDAGRGAFVGAPDAILFGHAFKTEVVGTAGAGDAFGATFTTYVALGRPVEEALRAATINSASVVGYIDTQTGLLKRAELDQRLAPSTEHPGVRRWRI